LLAFALVFTLVAVCGSPSLFAQPPIQPSVDITQVPAAAQPGPSFNADAATQAYMDMIPAAAKARSDSYFEGGYWLILLDFLTSSAILLLILEMRWSAGIRNRVERVTKNAFVHTALYTMLFILLTTLLGFPLEFYESFVREHQYGLATQTFWPWMGDEGKTLLLNLIGGSIGVAILFAIVRRCRQTWWIWGSISTVATLTFFVAIGPVFLQPIFNKITRLNDPKVTAPILRMAHANGIPTNDVYQIDASRQTNRMSANVSGFASTMRITLNDNLLRRGSPEEIQAVMGHEMGHYVLNHIAKDIEFIFIVTVCSFAYLRWGLAWSLKRFGARWQIREIGDPAILPLVFLLGGVLFFVLTPIMNTQTRTQEKEADMFGLNAARQPDGFAQAAIHLGEYRKMQPKPLEEFLFFDHPSGYNRIHSAMVWKGENLSLYPAPTAKPAQ
jgi:STE24 endopeptidase